MPRSLQRQQILQLQRQSKRIHGNDVIFVLKREPAEDTQVCLGFSVPRTCGSSVVRSRLKRLFRESVASMSWEKEHVHMQILVKRGKHWENPAALRKVWSDQECGVLRSRL